ncbi:hypothetical protein ENBRE01_0241 [Enteropsectra breve]|nr:hypothetical protein ENBRE01_0241 [Enteropsectra breve]
MEHIIKKLNKDTQSVQLLKYSGIKQDCTKCYLESVFTGSELSLKNKESSMATESDGCIESSRKERVVSALDKIALISLKLPHLPLSGQEELKKPQKPAENLVKYYLRFKNSINSTCTKASIREFDLKALNKILCSSIKNTAISGFVDKLVKDPLNYDKESRTRLFNILVFAYIYCRTNNMCVQQVKGKIELNKHLFKPEMAYELEYVDDPFINAYVGNLKALGDFYSEAIFISRVLAEKERGRAWANTINTRIMQVLDIIPNQQNISFFKIAFTHGTVLYSCISDLEVLKIVVDFYKSKMKVDQLFVLLIQLIEKNEAIEIHRYLLLEYRALDLKVPRYAKMMYSYEIVSFTDIRNYITYFNTNKDSFIALETGMGHLQKLHSCISDSGLDLEVLNILIVLFGDIKTNFMVNILSNYLSFLATVIERIDAKDQNVYHFNLKHWKVFSKIVLTAQRIFNNEDTGKKKKKDTGSSTNSKSRLLHKLVAVIVQKEEELRKAGYLDIVLLKQRGFQVEDKTIG